MKITRIKKAALITLFFGLTGLLTFTFLPSPMQNKSITFIPISEKNKSEMPVDFPTHLYRELLLTLSFPKWLWLGDSQYVILNIQSENSGLVEKLDLSSQYSTSLEARLELTSMEIYPGNIMFQVLQSEKPAQFLWEVTAENRSGSAGKLWLFVVINHSDEGIEWTIPVFALPIGMSIRSWLGWTLPIVRGMLITGLVFLIVLWIIFTTPRLIK